MDLSQSFNQPQGAYKSSEKSVMLQPVAPPPVCQDNPASFPSSSAQASSGQTVVAVQPAVFVPAAPLANPMPEYTCYSIFTMLCCCFHLGTAALVYSVSTRIANYSGQRELAERNSKTARTLNHVAVAIGISFIAFIIIYSFVTVNNTYRYP
ncbi:hypothetical protein QQF64_009328 [Cirrhinus molitorella]|uniref:Uncharacterized protein n=2 Tax=Cirrhinus molitorella TaxID=172907 RepID=A0AA88TQL1_9TELE|nr:hypothetical protein Q8A67_008246 [Cirrhinus molitorella]